ncbi:hypothetical protein L3C95_31795 [Chitinophaga filiformis]|uniref:hypothetical protein n=1 Tax=Chitinophaga filiformis TaxID=104663 RepID=UPI001F23AEFF|nr:hypothetical protein [Chitinophaga filiformis]MCF6407518.1 hypothetical protein [Chitinophaga filiformis]
MKKARVLLSAIAIFAVVGGAFAFKAKKNYSIVTYYVGTTSTLLPTRTISNATSTTTQIPGATLYYFTTVSTAFPTSTGYVYTTFL